MMNNLFSSFDPSTSNYFLSTNWISVFLVFLIPSSFWMIPSKLILTIKMINQSMSKETKTFMKKKEQMNSLMYTSLFTFIAMNNFMGLMPYVFTGTSHMIMNMSLALTMWTSIMMFSMIYKFNKLLAHLLPTSTPIALMSFMIIIETISSMIRPLALAIRLTANMIAGHMILTLIGSSMNPVNNIYFMPLIAQSMLMMLEMAVSIIQAYVFMILVTLYASELYEKN